MRSGTRYLGELQQPPEVFPEGEKWRSFALHGVKKPISDGEALIANTRSGKARGLPGKPNPLWPGESSHHCFKIRHLDTQCVPGVRLSLKSERQQQSNVYNYFVRVCDHYVVGQGRTVAILHMGFAQSCPVHRLSGPVPRLPGSEQRLTGSQGVFHA